MVHDDTVMEVMEVSDEVVQVTAVVCEGGITKEAIPGAQQSNL